MRNKLNFSPLSPQKPFKSFMETKLSPDKSPLVLLEIHCGAASEINLCQCGCGIVCNAIHWEDAGERGNKIRGHSLWNKRPHASPFSSIACTLLLPSQVPSCTLLPLLIFGQEFLHSWAWDWNGNEGWAMWAVTAAKLEEEEERARGCSGAPTRVSIGRAAIQPLIPQDYQPLLDINHCIRETMHKMGPTRAMKNHWRCRSREQHRQGKTGGREAAQRQVGWLVTFTREMQGEHYRERGGGGKPENSIQVAQSLLLKQIQCQLPTLLA